MFAIKEIKGLENWQNVGTGAIVTCNHFSPNDSFVTQKTLKASKKKKRLYANTKSFVDEDQAKTMDKFAIAREIVSRYASVPGCTITAEEEKRYESFARRIVALTVEMKSTGQSKEQYAQAIALSVLILEEYLITATDKAEQARRAHVLTQIQSSKIPDQNAYTILTKYRKMYYENKQKQ